MTPELRQRLLAYAKELVDAKVEQRKFFGGHRATVSDRLVSLDVAQYPEPEEEEDLFVRVWAQVSYSQYAEPLNGLDPELIPYPTKVVDTPPFPVFTLKPPESEEAARQAQLDQMEYYLENATVYSSPDTLLYPNSFPPLILAANGSSWSQFQFPPYYPTYPGFFFSDPDILAPFRVGGPVTIPGENFGDPDIQTVEASAVVTLYVRGHTEESLDEFENGGAVDPVKLTVRQVASAGIPGFETPIVQLQEDIVGYYGETFTFSSLSTSTFPEVDETVSLVGFEPR
jgi:hypothetical protein